MSLSCNLAKKAVWQDSHLDVRTPLPVAAVCEIAPQPRSTLQCVCHSRQQFDSGCFVNSSLRFLITNLHPICTCSSLFTPLTEGRSARDLTQAFFLLYAAWVRSLKHNLMAQLTVNATLAAQELAYTSLPAQDFSSLSGAVSPYRGVVTMLKRKLTELNWP